MSDKTTIFIDTQDMEERYGEELYKEYLEKENKQLKKQLEYLRSGEYINQLKFERNMLEDLVQGMEVSKEDKEFIDMTHRNTELLEVIEKANNELITLIQIIMEQPSKNIEEDNYLLSRLESISNILVGGNNE